MQVESETLKGNVDLEPLFQDFKIGLEHSSCLYSPELNVIFVLSSHDFINSIEIDNSIIAFDLNDNKLKRLKTKHSFSTGASIFHINDGRIFLFGSVAIDTVSKFSQESCNLFELTNTDVKNWKGYQDVDPTSFEECLKEVEPIRSTYEIFKDISGHTCHFQNSTNFVIGFGGVTTPLSPLSYLTRKSSQKKFVSNYIFHLDTKHQTFTNIYPKGLKNEYIPSPRCYHSTVFYNDRLLFSFGGLNYYQSKIYVYDTKYNLWIRPIDVPQELKHDGLMVLALVNDYLILVGGIAPEQSRLALFHLPTGKWKFYSYSEEEDSLLSSVYHSCVTVGNSIILIGLYKKKQKITKIHCKEFDQPFTGAYYDSTINQEWIRKELPIGFNCKLEWKDFRFRDFDEDEDEDRDLLMGIFG